jgi:thiol-disulfide isomerase/thioredoxin
MLRADEEMSRGVGQVVSLEGLPTAGQAAELLKPQADRKATVIVFTGIGCPIGNLYLPRLAELAKTFESKGVAFLGIDSNRGRNPDEVAAQAVEFGIRFPMICDPGNAIADKVLAERTCETLVIDAEGVLRYRGAIDDQYGLGFAKEAPEHSYLVEAIDAVLAGRSPDTSATSVVGCPIERVRLGDGEILDKLSMPERVNKLIGKAQRIRAPGTGLRDAWNQHAPDEDALIDEIGPVTWVNDVAPIIHSKCEKCHRTGEVGPFKLETFDEVKNRIEGIQEVVDVRRMPPWHADPRYGHFANDRSLTSRERAVILAWIEQGQPEGDGSAAKEEVPFADGWTIGQPDLVIRMDQPYAVKAEGFERYQRFHVPLNLTEDRWVQAAEARPSDRSVVHHIIAYLIPPGEKSPDPRRAHFCGYAPGDMPSVYPPGTAKLLPKGSSMMLEVHYTPNGKIRYDQSSVGFVFAKEPIEREALTVGIAEEGIQIPPGAPDHREQSKLIVREPLRLLSFMPHMHLRGKAFDYFATYTDGSTEQLLSVPAYDFGWQSYYTLSEPKDLKPGDRIDCVARYDNSSGNPVNPNPKESVRWGQQTWEEMMIGYIDVSIPLKNKVLPNLTPAAE